MSDGVWWPEFEQWIRAHDLDPADIAEIAWRPPTAGGIAAAYERPQAMEVLLYKRNEQGRLYKDASGDAATETRVVPMLHLPAVEVIRYR